MQSLRVNKDGVSASSEKQRLISMAQTAYEEAGMWAVKAYSAQNIKPSEINTEGRLYEDKSRNVSRIQITSHTLRHNFSNGFPALSAKQLPTSL
jgi:hypothetical protein